MTFLEVVAILSQAGAKNLVIVIQRHVAKWMTAFIREINHEPLAIDCKIFEAIERQSETLSMLSDKLDEIDSQLANNRSRLTEVEIMVSNFLGQIQATLMLLQDNDD